KIGTASLHEHNDKRIHLEGVVVNEHEDATLGNFMHVIDGNLERGSMTIPVGQNNLFEDDQDGDIVDTSNRTYIESMVRGSGNARYLDLMNGESCSGNADAQPAEVQVFVYRFDKDNDTYSQTKLDDPANYVYSPYSNVPPGDCIIFEFDSPKDFTDKLCLQYGLKDTKRCVEFGVPANEPEHCNITDTTDYTKLSEQAGVDVQEAPSSQSDSTERSN
ncbi:hypothetical protein KC878_03180, partial [Candidatus Saccharibacteria bacterium]|nr:hypothetical protein [Candidatus Saccharibacteria bacterium]